MGTSELDCGLNTLTAGAAKKHLSEPTSRKFAKPRGQWTSKNRHVALEHGRPLSIKLSFESRDSTWMIVSNIMNAVPGIEVENNPTICRMKFSSSAARINHIHLQSVEQPDPLRVDVLRIDALANICVRHCLKHGNPLALVDEFISTKILWSI